MIISRTPFRISFFGGGTDYPVWYEEHGGAALATTIDKYCYITCRYLPPFFEHRSRIAYSKIELVRSLSEIRHPSARETLRFMGIDGGVEIHHDADLPARTGLGSSSSFTVGLLHALHALKRRMPSKMQLAQESIHIERDLIREHVGSQDQVSAAFGGFNLIRFSPAHEISLRAVILPRRRLEELQAHLMLVFSGFSRNASEIAAEQIRRVKNRQTQLARIGEMVDEGLELLAGRHDLAMFGRLLHEGWKLKRSLSPLVSTSRIDSIYDAALKSGAIGGKLLGAGGGGFVLLFARPEVQARIRRRLKDLLHVPFRFETGGSQIIFLDHLAAEDEPRGRRRAPARPGSLAR
ncbi:MAG: kinase [Elusimicrobia bacterium]|nr:kinase [Elusimicrobiota bacterium]